MYGTDYRSAEAMMALRVREARRRAEYHRLCQAGVERRWLLSQQGCRLVQQLGRQLVMVGERLEGYGLPQPSI